MLIAMELLAFTTRTQAAWRGFFVATQIAVAATIRFTIVLSSGTEYDGLFQRLLIGTINLGVILVAIQMYRRCPGSE